jgi:hypothetical protein
MVLSFWATSAILSYLHGPTDELNSPSGSASSAIEIVQATYGMNCKEFKPVPPAENRVKPGNVTAPVSAICTKGGGNCDVGVLNMDWAGDPAPGCAKNFVVEWRCGGKDRVRQAQVDPEAIGKTVTISCP